MPSSATSPPCAPPKALPRATIQGRYSQDIRIRDQPTAPGHTQSQSRHRDGGHAHRGSAGLWANAAFSALTGYSQEEAIGRKPAELVELGVQDQSYYERMWETILAGRVWHGELVNKRRDGSLYDEELTITSVRAEDREITHFITIKQDVSARKAAEIALRESEKSYRGLFNSVSEAIYIVDETGHFLDVNRGAEAMYGYARDEFLGQSVELVEAPGKNDMEQLALHFRAPLAGETRECEFWGRRRNGGIFPSDARLNKGRHFGRDVIIAVSRDATERKAMEDELRHLAATDTLTGLANRRHFLGQMALALARHQRHGTPTALLDARSRLVQAHQRPPRPGQRRPSAPACRYGHVFQAAPH